MREEIKVKDESSIVENIGGRNRTLKASIPREEPSNEATEPTPEPVREETTEQVQRQSEIFQPREKPPKVEVGSELEASREDNRRRKGKVQVQPSEYEMLFMRDAVTTTRNGKAIYIRKEFHDRIMRIVQVIGYNELSLFSYVDNVLEHHFNSFQDDISELYKKRNPDIF